jgi:hypothetical protein
LAGAVDLLAHLDYLIRKAWFKGEHKVPQPLKRPGEPEELQLQTPPRMSSPAEIKAFFSGEGTRVVYNES